MNAIPVIKTADLLSEAVVDSSAVTLRLLGSAETASMSDLDKLLKKVHEVASAARVKEVIVDMRELEFMNSSCFKTFVSWVSTLQDVAADDQYRVCFKYDEKKHWQSRSLSALACFAVDSIRVESA